ncbi:Hypothetical_protein [Hexamita inflata]|uniref:Hypothetical_protein n=1 Tax=Hexamita inflata TaxID=28002 RepID=A0AA86Q5B4_9EUKA|nr:Hypothetical protein HINF_LOCUS40071 [Hexamita inflata]
MQELKENKAKITTQLRLLRQKLRYNTTVNKPTEQISAQIELLIQAKKQLQTDFDKTYLSEAQLTHKLLLKERYQNKKAQAQQEGKRYDQLEYYYRIKAQKEQDNLIAQQRTDKLIEQLSYSMVE